MHVAESKEGNPLVNTGLSKLMENEGVHTSAEAQYTGMLPDLVERKYKPKTTKLCFANFLPSLYEVLIWVV